MRHVLFAALGLLAVSTGQESPAPAPAPTPKPSMMETIDVNDMWVLREVNGTIRNISFLLSGRNATDLRCEVNDPSFPSEVYTCGTSKYRFALYPGNQTEYSLRLYHELGIGVGFYGQGDTFVYCHAGGLGRLACSQQFPISIVIDSLPDFLA